MNNIILVDWGTSNFRATLYDENFNVLDKTSNNNGMLSLEKSEFYDFLKTTLKDWFLKYKNIKVLLSGMVGSQNGWLETKYLVCDTNLKEVSKKLVKIPNIKEDIYIVPGVKTMKNNIIDLMRGEEVQIFGALKSFDIKDATLILPGTHCKWAEVKDENIIDFKTNMTGEVFNILSSNSILEKSIKSKDFNEEAFLKGINLAKKEGGLLNQIFQARAQASIIGENNIHSFLSAILISNEIKEMKNIFSSKEIIIVGSSTLNKLYEIALKEYDFKTQTISSELASLEAMKYIHKSI